MDAAAQFPSPDWVQIPTETEIYILPDGRVVIADMPIELGPLAEELGAIEPCEIVDDSSAPVAPPIARETQTPPPA